MALNLDPHRAGIPRSTRFFALIFRKAFLSDTRSRVGADLEKFGLQGFQRVAYKRQRAARSGPSKSIIIGSSNKRDGAIDAGQ
jgi:hypothetical protein